MRSNDHKSTKSDTPRPNIAARAGRWSATHKKTAILGWFAFVIVAMFVGGAVGQKNMSDVDSFTGSSARAEQAIVDHGLTPPAAETVIVRSDTAKVGDPRFDKAVVDVVESVRSVPVVRDVQSPLTRAGPAAVSADGHSALVQFKIAGAAEEAGDKIDPVLAKVKSVAKAHPDISIQQFGSASVEKELDGVFMSDLKKARNLSLPITMLILLFAFGALVAAGIPVLLAITAVMAAVGLIALPSHLSAVDEAVAEVILLIGMAVGVDYSLFYLKREREERAAGRGKLAAIEAAAATSGRAVLISGITVIAAMAGMLISGDKAFISFGVGTMMVVAIAMAGSVTVLPAMLSALGDKVNRGRIPWLGKRRERRELEGETGGIWSVIVDRVLRHPAISAVLATALLLAIAAPALQMKTQQLSVTDFPQSLSTMKAYAAIQQAFPSENLAAEVVYENSNVRSAESRKAIADFSERVAATPGFYAPREVRYSNDGEAAQISVPLAHSSNQATAEREIMQLRNELIPQTLARVPGAGVNVSGMAASSIDFNELMANRVPLVFTFVLALAFLLLLVTFRSVVIPVKAIILNLLSVAAAYGVLVLVFQEGWGAGLLGVDHTGAIQPFLPLFLFVILFGLSMDYHVFILSRIREAYDGGLSSNEAVAFGIKSTAGVVTSAATVMVAVFAIFGSLTFLPLKQMGVGLAAAVLIDATIIRAVLLPASMRLLGEWNWYLPRWLQWLPKVQAERSAQAPAPVYDADPEVAPARA